MKNITKKNEGNPMAEIRNSKNFSKFFAESTRRIYLGVEIFNAREVLGLSQGALAKEVETTQAVISRIENGDVNVGFNLLSKIAEVLEFNHENWGRIWGFDSPYKILFVGGNTASVNRDWSMDYKLTN